MMLDTKVDLRSKMPPVWDQGQIGDCTAFALTAAVAFLHGYVGSQIWLYYKERLIEHTIGQDLGAQISDGIRVLATEGLPLLTEWSDAPSKLNEAPTPQVDTDASKRLITSYRQLLSSADMLTCLESGFPFVVGITLFESFESDAVAANGIVPMPKPDEACEGGHAVCVVGYTTDGNFIVRNSWGADWGMAGYFVLPGAYFADNNLWSDAWVITADNEK